MAYRLRFLALGLAITLLGATTGLGLRVAIAAFTDSAPVANNTFATRASFNPIAFVKSVGTATSCATTSTRITVPGSGVAAGNTLVVRFAYRSTPTGPVGVTDSRGNTYTKHVDVTGFQVRLVVLTAHVATALSSGDTITVSHPAADVEGAAVAEFSGVRSVDSVDTSGTASGESTTPTASLTTSHPRTVLYGAAVSTNPRTYTEAAGWTTHQHMAMSCGGTKTADNHGAYRIVSSAGAFTYSPTKSGSDPWAAAVIALRATT